ncbi:TetR/AcrR family transcriptional regulator [Sphingomonas sp. CL5.1]|uniref:TetR/AcrR family transcriptional regulator n=1 Tax=Sphingomonas sp. CL5.1 TaxID=2653203 RepID=UPI001581DF61|nr:TetR/AcrR family transcriptional regulator [Sphingomonas sp. CL5.1]QKR99859.1 TetR/AcrR family transcriptional regulator [Sphingomonas sp. CL5.1]
MKMDDTAAISSRAPEAADSRPRASTPETGGEGTVTERILDSAESVLRTHGYAGFSTRRVAMEASIALGNLTYHFPTKSRLVQALIDRLMKRYLERFEDVLQTPGQGLESLVKWLLGEAATEEATWLFRELWAMARHDEIVSDALDDFYDELMDRVAVKLEATYPAANPGDIRDLVQFIAVISEGTAVLYGTRRNRVTPHHRIVDLVIRLTGEILPAMG